jgi:putative PIN family toxin of toxin-antitoxin system
MLVIDTNVLISSALFPKSPLGKIVGRAVEFQSFALSGETFAELKEVLMREKFDRYLGKQTRIAFLEKTAAKARWVDIGQIPHVRDCRDEKDNKFLEVALAAKAKHLITGDQDLLMLDPWHGIRILTPADFGTLDCPRREES